MKYLNMIKEVHRKKLFIVLVIAIVGGVCIFGINSNKNDNQNTTEVTAEDNKDEDNENIYQGSFDKLYYSKSNDFFVLGTNNDEIIFVTKEGKITDASDSKCLSIASKIFEKETRTITNHKSHLTSVYDINGNNITKNFIKEENEKLISITSLGDRDVVWVLKDEETRNSTLNTLICYDENGNQLSSVLSTGINYDGRPFDNTNFKGISKIEYVGSNVCRIYYTGASTEPYFNINVDTGKILDPSGEYDENYAIICGKDDNRSDGMIIDNNGNIIQGVNSIISKGYPISEGVFYSKETNKFYDINLNVVIDLNSYSTNMDYSFYDNGTVPEPFIFIDGYCQIQCFNNDGVPFRAIIDKSGAILFEEKNIGNNAYWGKYTEDKLNIGNNEYYDIKTKERGNMYFPTEFDGNYQTSATINHMYYYINEDNEFCVYDLTKQKNIVFDL